MTSSNLNGFLKGAGVGAIAACLLGVTAYGIRGDRYSFSHFLTTLSGMTIVSGLAAAIAISTQDQTYEQGYQAALAELEKRLTAEDSALARPTLMVQNGQKVPVA
jgi:ribose/xylose/arabinose/galactoside ABC-type transport system permease subunit